MSEKTTPRGARDAAVQMDLRRLIDGIAEAAAEVGKVLERGAKQRAEAQEVSALFTLHRQLRAADTPSDQPMPADARELRARLVAAVHGYGSAAGRRRLARTADASPRTSAANSDGSLRGRRPLLALPPAVSWSALLPRLDGGDCPQRGAAGVRDRFGQVAAGAHPVNRGALNAEPVGELRGGEEPFHAVEDTLSCWT